MKAYLLNLWDTLRTSYWFVPSLLATGAVLLSLLMPTLDAVLAQSAFPLPTWARTTTDTARATLSTMAGAILSVTGTVFSITIVTLSLTSQQFGPRLLRRFMYDLPTQLTLGVFLATGFYCLLLLRIVEHQGGGEATPHLSVLVAVTLTLFSMAMLIVFIHNIAMLIQAPQVVTSVARDLDDAILRLFPEKIGQPASEAEDNSAARHQEMQLSENYRVIRSTCEGYIQAIDESGLMNLARHYDLVLRLMCRPGQFMSHGAVLAHVWSENPDGAEQFDTDNLAVKINEAFIVGIRRTPRQDVECAVEELVEVGVRSLSPGINDPFTAINCIDRLGAALGRFAERKLPTPHRCDNENRLRIIAHRVNVAEVLGAAFNQLRQHGRSSVAVTIRLLEAFAVIAEHVHRMEDRDALKEHAQMVARVGATFSDENDQQDVKDRFDRVMELLGRQN